MGDFVAASIASPSSSELHLGPVPLHAYGAIYGVALVTGMTILVRRWERAGGRRAVVQDAVFWGFLAGVAGARLYHLATSWDEVPHHWWGPFAIWRGGLGSWGAFTAGTLTAALVIRRNRASIPLFLDALAPALLVAQAIGRAANYVNQELFGRPTSLPWAVEIDPAHRPAGYGQYATFHPTFLYEMVWNLALAGVLVWLGRRRAVRPPGLFALYVAGYSLARAGTELLRIEPARHVLGMRVNFWVALAGVLAGALWFARTRRAPRARPAEGRVGSAVRSAR